MLGSFAQGPASTWQILVTFLTNTPVLQSHLGQLGDDLRQQLRGILLAQLVALERLEYCLDLHLVSLQTTATKYETWQLETVP